MTLQKPNSNNAAETLTFSTRLQDALASARHELLQERNGRDHWEGKLASSALSTATAVAALSIGIRHEAVESARAKSLVEQGLKWLATHANSDGGWGDTELSQSNISTTTLVWAAFGSVPDADKSFATTVANAEQWLAAHAGGVTPDQLAPTVIERYGKDRTFSVPILTMCALSGRLGRGVEAWRWVIPLPFELALFPQRWYAMLRLPVVSYALPALIAIGQARHFHAPSRNPLVRGLRHLARPRTLRVLGTLQPTNGGFLEATPLTSFVAMSLAASGHPKSPVTQKGLDFIIRSIRPDGSWPIDTNLTTWLTTLSVNALSQDPDFGFERDEAVAIQDWVREQQYRQVHPYTGAEPGGWAWTNLPGGVPDADDTAGALLALRRLGPADTRNRDAAEAGAQWLLDLQNPDGGIPTFCRGWGKLPFDRSSPDLTAHTIRAWQAWLTDLSDPLKRRTENALRSAIRYLIAIRKPNGTWSPLWFGNEHARDEENLTYGTSRVLLALQAPALQPLLQEAGLNLNTSLQWLLAVQNPDGGWSGNASAGPSSVEETGLALEALALRWTELNGALTREERQRFEEAIRSGAEWLMTQIETGAWRTPSPIGFYFARLWYYERLYPMIFSVGALTNLNRLAPSLFE